MKILRNTRNFNPLSPEVEIDVKSLNIIPLFDINTCNFDLEKTDLNRTLLKNNTAVRILFNKNLIDYIYFSNNLLEFDYKTLQSKYKNYKERIKESIYGIFNNKVILLNTIASTNFQFNEKVYINVFNIKDNFQFKGNNQNIKSVFDNLFAKKVIRNNEKLAIYYGSVFKEVSEGIYPVLLSGIDANKIDSFKLNLLYNYINEPTDFNSVKVYVDKDWYLQSCNKSLKTYLLKSLNEKYYNYELILFDGKEFANQNMFSYQPLSFSTLSKKKKYFTEIETKLFENLTKNYVDNFDYKILQKTFLDKYTQLLENNRKEKENIEESKPEILETRSLTSEEMSLIDSLFQNDFATDLSESEGENPVENINFLPTGIHYSELTPSILTDYIRDITNNSTENQEIPVENVNSFPTAISHPDLNQEIPSFDLRLFDSGLEESISQIDETFTDLEDELRRIANEIQNG
jgi:hypothetical protein